MQGDRTSCDLPDGIGPHEGREFELMEKGDKDVALFYEIKPDGFDAFVQKPDFHLIEWVEQGVHPDTGAEFSVPYWIVYREGRAFQAKEVKRLTQAPAETHPAVREVAIGRYLGYDPKDIARYIDHIGLVHFALLPSGGWAPIVYGDPKTAPNDYVLSLPLDRHFLSFSIHLSIDAEDVQSLKERPIRGIFLWAVAQNEVQRNPHLPDASIKYAVASHLPDIFHMDDPTFEKACVNLRRVFKAEDRLIEKWTNGEFKLP